MQDAPSEIRLHKKSRLLEVSFDGGVTYRLSCEYLRVFSPSAEVRGHGAAEPQLVAGKQDVSIMRIEPVGHYAVRLHFTDGHNTGLYSWAGLRELGENQATHWARYLQRMQEAGLSRDPAAVQPLSALFKRKS